MRHSSYLEVNLGLMAQNFSEIQKLAQGATVLPMVKANAYGNGLVEVSQFLAHECGVRKLGVATLGEALRLMEECPGLNSEILVFSDTELQNPEAREAYLNFNITPVLYQKSDLEVVLGDPSFKRIPLVIKVNTGMNRLGMAWEEIEPFLTRIKGRGIQHLMTHFARSSQLLREGDKTHRQYEEFKRVQNFLLNGGMEIRETSVANSGAIEQGFAVDETYVRPGLMLYGPPSVLEPQLWKGHQCSRLVTKVLTSFSVKKGLPVGYGVNVVDKDGFMVVISMGYGDGLVSYGSGTRLSVNGQVGRIFGRINMDMAYILFDPSAEGKIKNEDVVELWNHDNRVIADIATQNKTIAYQLMCGISSRIPRIYKVK